MFKFLLIELSFLLCFHFALSLSTDCSDKCDVDKCPEPVDCFAGLIKDKCNCCSICGQLEGNRCYDANLKGLNSSYQEHYGGCGENLECRLRDDLAANELVEAICFCTKDEMICGNDGQTYENICQLNEARYKRRDGLAPISYGPCQSAPKIVTKPGNLNASLGQNEAFMCQATGWPIPTIHWKVMLKNNHIIQRFTDLPSDDSHIAVQSRGGSKSLEVTSWLQIIGIREDDQGEYHCVASNEFGDTFAYGVLTIGADQLEKSAIKKNKV